MFVTHITGKGLIFKICKELIPIRKTGKMLEHTLHIRVTSNGQNDMKSALSFSHERNEN